MFSAANMEHSQNELNLDVCGEIRRLRPKGQGWEQMEEKVAILSSFQTRNSNLRVDH